ncbi:hypothetical protein GCM10017559_07870 [Streptosporangium longisporum]|uniref:DUF3073 domain-containing protein n=1 Tax=Streptosporangium longisporum TaxID=46187 RepID=A0ABN3XRN4_9ACTN
MDRRDPPGRARRTAAVHHPRENRMTGRKPDPFDEEYELEKADYDTHLHDNDPDDQDEDNE